MTIHQKLKRLTRFGKIRTIGIAAGLGPSSFGSLLTRESEVTTRVAAALARVLEVDVAWLIDDSKGWPPVYARDSKSSHAA